MKKRSGSWIGAFLCSSILAAALASSPAHASDHEDLGDWCTESQAQLAACVLGALVVGIPLILHELGERFEDACVNSGGEYREGVGPGYPTGPAPETQWGCDEA